VGTIRTRRFRATLWHALLRLVSLCIVIAPGLGCGSLGSNQNNARALNFDPWYPPSDQSENLEVIGRNGFDDLGLDFVLAKGPGEELAIEYRKSTRSVRLTYRMPSLALYRIVQRELDPKTEVAPEFRTDPVSTHLGIQLRGLDRSEGLSPWSMVWWDCPQLEEVEIASESLSMSDLVDIAQEIIDDAQ